MLGFLLAAAVMVSLGNWQLDRMHQKRAANAAISSAIEADPVAPADLLPDDAGTAVGDAEWRKVTVTGTYLVDEMILVRQRSFPEGVGLEVVVPLAADDGHTYLISRGYVLAPDGADRLPEIPETPSGEVTVTGWVRPTATQTSDATTVDDIAGIRSVRVLNAQILQDDLGEDLTGGYIQATEESPDAAEISRVPLPELDDGPHLSYAVQWYIFSAVTLIGFGYLVRREAYDRLLADEELDDLDMDDLDDLDDLSDQRNPDSPAESAGSNVGVVRP